VTPAFSLKEFGMHLFAPFSELGAPFFFSFYFVMIDLLFIYIKKKEKGKERFAHLLETHLALNEKK